MATHITEDCINCGACEPECPNEAISEGDDIYVIDPNLCTECVGFHEREACQAVCPVECCLPDPARAESEAQLYARTIRIHGDRTWPALADLTAALSRFRK
jgi:ferredoxin